MTGVLSKHIACFFPEKNQLMVCWFGALWFGFLESKMKGIVTWVYPYPNHRTPNQQLTIS